jgi:hypothetical protein
MSPAQLRARLDEVRAYWRERAAVSDYIGEVCRALLTDDEELRRTSGDAMMTTRFWQSEVGDPAADVEPEPTIRHAGLTPDPPDPPRAVGIDAAPATGGDGSWPSRARQLLGALLIEPVAVATRVRRPQPPVWVDVDATRVIVRWRPSGASEYRVVKAFEPVTAPDEAQLVAVTKDLMVTDPEPLIARPVYYSVFANARGDANRLGQAEVTVLPPVTSASADVSDGGVRLTWTAHPDTHAVRVTRTVGSPPRSAEDGTALEVREGAAIDPEPAGDTEIFYAITASYLDDRARERYAQPVVVTFAPGLTHLALDGCLHVEAIGGNGAQARVRITWPAALGARLRVYRSAQPQGARTGLMPVSALSRLGEEVTGERATAGRHVVLEALVPTGYLTYVPVLVRHSTARVGQGRSLGIAEPVRGLRAERAGGSEVVLTWQWPRNVTLAVVRWAGAPASTERLVTRAEYLEHNGCRIDADDEGRAYVVAIVVTEDGELRSQPTDVAVTARRVRIRYQVGRPAAMRARQRVITVRADRDCAGVTLHVAFVPGNLMPLTLPAQHVTTFADLSLTADRPLALPVIVDPEVHRRKPYWIRCFVDDGASVQLVDPPVHEMKVG